MSGTDVRLASLPGPVGVLLRAVHDALDIPLPGLTDADERAHAALLQQRSISARVILACVLEDGHNVGTSAEALRARTADMPVTYTPWQCDGGAA
ncbi:hypothetical protein [Streptomyces acidiscabies]|uniref:hypothetical protein n=1 Tax=Streptomyces acidiscabies TaxID=42234 RepID=UPI00073E48A2|nr:hypothetical protein [Streptomyces acidiscabies]GAQ58751.1 hypothetical protein a10_08647 [Streptomyces acidiscabies]